MACQLLFDCPLAGYRGTLTFVDLAKLWIQVNSRFGNVQFFSLLLKVSHKLTLLAMDSMLIISSCSARCGERYCLWTGWLRNGGGRLSNTESPCVSGIQSTSNAFTWCCLQIIWFNWKWLHSCGRHIGDAPSQMSSPICPATLLSCYLEADNLICGVWFMQVVVLRRPGVHDIPAWTLKPPVATILGIGTNNDGYTKESITFPSSDAQTELARKASCCFLARSQLMISVDLTSIPDKSFDLSRYS